LLGFASLTPTYALQKPKSGNTIGRVEGETPSALVPASEANPPVEETESESVLEESVPPNEELQELLEAREDTRTWWEKTEDWGNGA
jgi:hypothetical protein